MGFPARYKGTCMKCQQVVEVGQYVSWSRRPGHKGVYHINCANVTEIPVEKESAPVEPVEKTNWITDESTATPDVQSALATLMAALQPKQEKPVIDVDEIKRIVRETVTAEGTLRIEVTRKDAPTIKLDLAHKNFPILLEYVSNGDHVYMYGPHGSGKSTAASQVAEALGRSYGYISLTPQTAESRLLGYMDANGRYISTAYRQAYECICSPDKESETCTCGGVFCIDELDNASPALLTTLNGGLENGHQSFPDKIVRRGKNFVLIGTGNTSGKGANPSYPERRPFDAAFADRFTYLPWDYDKRLEKKIALAINPESEKWTEWVQDVRQWAAKNHPRFVPSPRATFRIAKYMGSKIDRDTMLDSAVFRGDSDLKTKVLANCPLPA